MFKKLPQKRLSTLGFILFFIQDYKYKIIMSFFFCVLTLLLWGSLGNEYLSKFVESLNSSPPSSITDASVVLMACSLSCWIGGEVSNFFCKVLHGYIYPQVEQNVRMSCFSYVQKFSFRYLSRHGEGYLENYIDCISEGIRECVQFVIEDIGPQCLFIIFQLVILMSRNRMLGLVSLSWIIVFAIIFFQIYKRTTEYTKANTKKSHERTEHMIDVLKNRKSNAILNLFSKSYARIDKIHTDERVLYEQYIFSDARNTLILSIVTFLIQGVGIYFSLYHLYRKSLIGLPDVIYVLTSGAWLVHTVFSIFGRVASLIQSWGQTIQSISHFYEGFELTHQISHYKNTDAKLDEIEKIEFRNVKYEIEGKKIFENLNLVIEKGDKVCIVGKSGSGKTTILDMISGLVEGYEGEIFINGFEIKGYRKQEIRQRVGYITQASELFDISIRENLRITRDNITEAEILEVLDKVNLSDVVRERGIDFRVGVSGSKLSGGQGQRLCIARALLRNNKTYFFDEVTSSLDPFTAKKILEIFLSLTKDFTSVFIDHSMLLPPICNKIIFLQNPTSFCVDSHENLLASSPEYSSLFHLKRV